MHMIACPECGLPRRDDQVGVVPCPVCAVAGTQLAAAPVAPARTQPADPTVGLPADVGEMDRRAAAPRQPFASPIRPGWAVAFLLGTAVGVGGVFAWQAAFPLAGTTEVAKLTPTTDLPSGSVSKTPLVAVAPAPHAPRIIEPKLVEPEPKPVAKLPPKVVPPPPAQARILDLNQPDASYTVQPALKNGQHLVLRGKVRLLRVTGLEAGAILDASGLDAGSIYVGGTIDGGSVLKLNAPDSVVAFKAVVLGQSRVEIHAPGGNVYFSHPKLPEWTGSVIDGGSIVRIEARIADLRGDVAGAETKVHVTLTRNGSLKIVAVRGTAAVEYKTSDAKSEAVAKEVMPTATFRKIE